MPTGSSTVGSPSPGSSKQASCNDDQSLIFSPHHLPNLKHNRLYLTSERPRPGPLNVVVPTVLVPQCRRQHEAQIVPDSRGLVPGIHVFAKWKIKTWMAGTTLAAAAARPAMTSPACAFRFAAYIVVRYQR